MIYDVDMEKAKLNIKRNLWRWGFKVKDMTAYVAGRFDLHVIAEDRSFRVKVMEGEMTPPEPFSEAGAGYDAVAMVVGKKNKKRFYALGRVEKYKVVFDDWKQTPTGVFRESKR